MSSVFDKIIQPEEFWCNASEKIEAFSSKDLMYFYDPYSVKFTDANFTDTASIRRFVFLDILSGNSQILDSGLIIQFHINVKSHEEIVSEMIRTAKEAHDRFIELFKEYRHRSNISETFQPTFDPSIAARRTNESLWPQYGT